MNEDTQIKPQKVTTDPQKVTQKLTEKKKKSSERCENWQKMITSTLCFGLKIPLLNYRLACIRQWYLRYTYNRATSDNSVIVAED